MIRTADNFRVAMYGWAFRVVHGMIPSREVDQAAVQPSAFSGGIRLSQYMSLLQSRFSGQTVATLADTFISARASPAVDKVNIALNCWRSIWDRRKVQETDIEHRTFFGNPLPFWWLIKLYLLVHLVDMPVTEKNDFTLLKACFRESKGQLDKQEKIVSWVRKFRRVKSSSSQSGPAPPVVPENQSWLDDLMPI